MTQNYRILRSATKLVFSMPPPICIPKRLEKTVFMLVEARILRINAFHYVILSIAKLWNPFGASGILFPSYLGHKNRPKTTFLGKKGHFWAIFFKILSPI